MRLRPDGFLPARRPKLENAARNKPVGEEA
jgi:hypothetical protein